ncbi:hypothetical protein AB4K20DRAFT_1981426 [Rhizopus microsporus]|uniref:Ricin B lectin domain-containing protein n=1 Tax=Rhizopus microsporus TaxID=58291 RepID=A0A1X0SD75_RHIZD|nr:hypothetical protein BCV71DRAFT_271285 [Rhizopus microsporus]
MCSKRCLRGGLFFIKSKYNGSILEVLGSCISGFSQFWSYDNGYFVNANCGKVMAVCGGPIKPKADIVQHIRLSRRMTMSQRWGIDHHDYIHMKHRPNLVLELQGSK